jgi:hypothetical protein
MTDDDVLFGYRLRLFTLADELGNVSEACRQMGSRARPIIKYATKKQPLHATWTRNPIGLLCGLRPTKRDDGSPGPSYGVANQIGNVIDELSLDLCGALLKLDDKGPDRYLKA